MARPRPRNAIAAGGVMDPIAYCPSLLSAARTESETKPMHAGLTPGDCDCC